MAQRYYLYYKQIGTGSLTVGKPSGYPGFLNNPDLKRMSFDLPADKGKAGEMIGRFVQDFQRLNAKKFSISNAVTQDSSTPVKPSPIKPPVISPGTGGTEPKPPAKIQTNSEKVEPDKEDNTMIIGGVLVLVLALIVWKSSQNKKKRKR
ncbi:hypothetical protein [Leptospira stimsonii]|uniref:Uncharacterized protein n=1 Tax=Leptospira stimsonii TaxID=2202203 RepID=A0ABY2MV04_9LEPT|nr:hypothetical protein [Leptospira stimsonii]TGK25375.1 hypothetical protein EHO98_02965 [Leptospira stimsonii]TGM08794.1 hypothetical protein EHQ90_22150 [Leptospira stimsonii]